MIATIRKNKMAGVLMMLSFFAALYFIVPQPAKADDGQKLYEQNCAKCHGPDGSGNTQIGKAVGAKDLRASGALKLTDAQIATQIQQGKGNMPPLSSLGKAQIDAIIPYLRGLGKKQTAQQEDPIGSESGHTSEASALVRQSRRRLVRCCEVTTPRARTIHSRN